MIAMKNDMTAKEYLRQYRDADDAINAKLDQIHRLRELATKTTQTLAKDRVRASGEQDKVAKIVTKIVDMEREVDADIDGLREVKRQVEDTIAGVSDPRERKVLTLRYINGLRWEEIAVQLNYHYRWVLELHGRGLRAVEKNMEAEQWKS
jgi:DNA-directed RNA polymerase specialized sigma24 family protein